MGTLIIIPWLSKNDLKHLLLTLFSFDIPSIRNWGGGGEGDDSNPQLRVCCSLLLSAFPPIQITLCLTTKKTGVDVPKNTFNTSKRNKIANFQAISVRCMINMVPVQKAPCELLHDLVKDWQDMFVFIIS